MTLYILDTDTLSLLQHGHPKVSQECAARRPSDLAITVISVEEQLSGWYTVLRKSRRPEDLARAYQRLVDTVSDDHSGKTGIEGVAAKGKDLQCVCRAEEPAEIPAGRNWSATQALRNGPRV